MTASMEPQRLLKKRTRDGRPVTVDICPEDNTGLSYWLKITIGDDRPVQISASPYRLPEPAAPGLTHGLSIGYRQTLGLTASEAETIEYGVTTWVAQAKAAVDTARREAAARVRAAAPDAETWVTSDPYSEFGVGEVLRDGDKVVTVLKAWRRYYAEDARSFGADDDSGYVHYARVRTATPDEAAPLLAHEAKQALRTDLATEVTAHITGLAEPGTTDGSYPPASVVGDLDHLPVVKVSRRRTGDGLGYIHLRVDEEHGTLWVLRYNGADGDNWSASNWHVYIACRLPLTPRRAELVEQLRNTGPVL